MKLKSYALKPCAVMGTPIEHSLSPALHRALAQSIHLSLEYQALNIHSSVFEKSVDEFFKHGGGGINITLPHKNIAAKVVDKLSEQAQLARAVNTIWIKDKFIHGDNTDGAGWLKDFTKNKKHMITDKKIIIIGAGGAAQGLIAACLQKPIKSMTIINRCPNRLKQCLAPFISYSHYQEKLIKYNPNDNYDIIIHATSAGWSNNLPEMPTTLSAENAICYDLNYGKGAVPFLNWARSQNAANTYDGWGMLVEQAALAFYKFHQLKPITTNILNNPLYD